MHHILRKISQYYSGIMKLIIRIFCISNFRIPFSSYSFQSAYYPSGTRLKREAYRTVCVYLSQQNSTDSRLRNVFDKSQEGYLLVNPLSELSTLSSPTRARNLNKWKRSVDDRYICTVQQDRTYF